MNGLRCLADGTTGKGEPTLFLADLDILGINWPQEVLWDAPEVETARARRYRNPELGIRFLASRRLLRFLIASQCHLPVEAVVFHEEPQGKLSVRNLPLQFNLSRSGTLVAIGLSFSGKIGVDIECNPAVDTCLDVSARVLTPGEQVSLPIRTRPDFVTAFLKFWTLKEAILKTTGEGLGRDMREIELDTSGEHPLILSLPESYGPPEDWEIDTVPTGLPSSVMAYARLGLTRQ